ncbi:Os03g0840050 [Oryza sativa Japonica Group]|uniref:Os03g0840050 protein n=1 Tax=Oryza sativa subsp. japonica TaxID=39947 RepID=A0A0P0W5F5_ORYSJ|nr:Os03g0840050 [Oryza sativa Japonica Group]
MAESHGRGLDGDGRRERCAADGGQREREWRPPSAADDVDVDLGILGDSLLSPIPFYRPGRSVPATATATATAPSLRGVQVIASRAEERAQRHRLAGRSRAGPRPFRR